MTGSTLPRSPLDELQQIPPRHRGGDGLRAPHGAGRARRDHDDAQRREHAAGPRHRRQAAEHTSGGGGGIVRTIVGLAVVIGVIVGLHWILKQVKSSRESRSTGGGLQPLATLALGPGRSLHLVRAGLEVVLVGCAEHAVTPLRVYSEDEARELGLLDLADGDDDGDDHPGAPGRRRGNPLDAGRGSPPDLRDIFRRIQRLTVRG